MATEEIIEKITSGDTHKVWEVACEVIKLGQNHEKIVPLIEYLPLIEEKTVGLDMGGGFAVNQRLYCKIKTLKLCFSGDTLQKLKQ